MKLITKIPLLILLLGFLSCTKGGGNIYVEGRVYNPVTGEGVPNAEVKLTRTKTGGAPASQSGGYKSVKTVQTDADGYYEISHSTILVNEYFIQMDLPGNDYYPMGFIDDEGNRQGGSLYGVDKGKNMYLGFEVVPYGYLQLNVENVNCQGSNDKFEFYPKYTVDPDYSALQPSTWEGCYATDNPPYSKLPSGRWIFKWEATKNGNTVVDSIEVDIIGNDSVVANINY